MSPSTLLARISVCGLAVVLAGCGTGTPTTSSAPATRSSASSQASATSSPPSSQDIMGFQPLGPIESGRYFIDPDGDPATPLRVAYEVAAEGWSQWIGAAKFSDAGHVGVSITTVSNLVTDGCRDHTWADPAVGPSVADLGAALVDLGPFQVTSPPTDVAFAGYRGTHLAWTVPELPVASQGGGKTFSGCDGDNLKSWVAFVDTELGDAFYGYTGPGYREEFWILDVDGTRLMIAAEQSAGSPAEDVAERDAILESIIIAPS